MTIPKASTFKVAAVLMVGAAWLLFAVWAVVRSVRIGAQTKLAQAWGLRLRGLLATAPGAYLICGDAGRVTVSDRLGTGWASATMSVRFEELGPEEDSGLEGVGFTELETAISATSVSGVPFSCPSARPPAIACCARRARALRPKSLVTAASSSGSAT